MGKIKKGMAILIDSYTLFNNIQKKQKTTGYLAQ
jgi:hypothetical protein